MGPAIIFDKSVIQSLSVDEAVWLDHFYLSVITPTYFVEVLADLSKTSSRSGDEAVVGNLANKTPDYSSKVNATYWHLIEGELFSRHRASMDGRPNLSGGKNVMLGDGIGVFYEESQEEQSFARWQSREFKELERDFASKWRKGLSNIDLAENYSHFQSFFPLGKPRDLKGVKSFTDFYLNESDQETVLNFGMRLLGANPESYDKAIGRWKSDGKRPIKEYAPYFYHVISVDLFFNLGIASDLIGRGRPSHKIDLSYLYYLPFCKIFTSNDKLHISIAPLFLKDDQMFLVGTNLKADLVKLNTHYDSLDQETKKRGISSFATYPPNKEGFLTSELWDKYMSREWRKGADAIQPFQIKKPHPHLADMLDEVRKGTPLTPAQAAVANFSDPKQMVIKRMVKAKKGSWDRFPPEVVNRHKNDAGEWVDD